MRHEQSWRAALGKESEKAPEKAAYYAQLADQILTIMTGGDYALIRSVEGMEDYAALGARQAEELGAGPGDLLIGVTATAETTAILGTAEAALAAGGNVWMLVCSDPVAAARRLSRTRSVYSHQNTHSLYLHSGPMALTGSVRMQASSIEQAVLGFALSRALDRLVPCPETITLDTFVHAFQALVERLCMPEIRQKLANWASREASLYTQNRFVTYFSRDYALDLLTDTTERSPTFMVPPFRPLHSDSPPSWAFVKNPGCDTKAAWHKCLGRAPRCIDWELTVYREAGFTEDECARIPRIDTEALFSFPIGSEPDPEREANGLALWVDAAAPDEDFLKTAKNYPEQDAFSLSMLSLPIPATRMNLLEHLAMKLILNTVSTTTMAIMGRIDGNWMTWLNLSNKKLIDRSARIVQDQCGVTYPVALEEVFLSKARVDAMKAGDSVSPAQMTIRRLLSSGKDTIG